MPVKETIWKKHMSLIKDVVFIVGILVSTVGWIRSETIKKNNLENQVKILTEAVDGNTKQLKEINTILMDQNLLNGKIIQYMSTQK